MRVAYLELLDAAVTAPREANELGELKGLVVLWSRPLDRSPNKTRHTEYEVSSHSSSPECDTTDLATLDDGVTAGAVLCVLVLTHCCVVPADALGSVCEIRRWFRKIAGRGLE